MLYITDSPLLNPEIRDVLTQTEGLFVSGRPLNIWLPEKEFHYDQCPDIVDMPFAPRLLVVVTIPDVGHRHIDPSYRGEYVAVTGIGLEDGGEYRFGIRDELGFSLTRAISVALQSNPQA